MFGSARFQLWGNANGTVMRRLDSQNTDSARGRSHKKHPRCTNHNVPFPSLHVLVLADGPRALGPPADLNMSAWPHGSVRSAGGVGTRGPGRCNYNRLLVRDLFIDAFVGVYDNT